MKAETPLVLFPPDANSAEGPTLEIEQSCWKQGFARVAGVDEAGRGCLAGPVVAAAAIFPVNFRLPDINDSKKIRRRKREELAETIRRQATAYATGMCTPGEIDAINILQASLLAMNRAVQSLSEQPDYVLIDGNMAPEGLGIPFRTIVKGDFRSHAIAAASIIAKTTRDALMLEMHDQHPVYGWNTNMGYPTAGHYRALGVHGPSCHHRRSFRLL